MQHGLIAAQIAFALVLLVASGLMIRTFQSLLDVDPGFVAPDDVQTVSVFLPEAAVPDFTQAVRLFEQMQDALGPVAGVESVGFGSRVPLENGPSAAFFTESSALPEDIAPPASEFRYTSTQYFATLGTPLVAGRTFDRADHHDAREVAVVSESFARREWGTPRTRSVSACA